jgi:tagaturonate reductase
MIPLPETILQFGAGKFLRGFADLFVHQANQDGHAIGRIVVVQSTGEERARRLNDQQGRYHVLVRGLSGGATVDRVEESASVSRALVATSQWPLVLDFARSANLRLVLSNTTEVGYDLDPADTPELAPPRSFPAKLLTLLHERFRAGGSGLTIVPSELFEHNATRLQDVVRRLAEQWRFPPAFDDWLCRECIWLNTLVDRIVVLPPREHPLNATDALAVMAEPYALWAVEDKPGAAPLPRLPAVVRTPDVQPYFLRKVRILNAAHTALAPKALQRGYTLVREAVADEELADWLNRLLFEEVLPVLEGRVEQPADFARQTLERFRNPFLEHKLRDVVVYHEAKVRIRLQATRDEYVAKFGRTPPLLEEAIQMVVPN